MLNIESIIEDVENDIENIRNLSNVPDEAKTEVLAKLYEVSDALDRWIDEYPEEYEDEENEDDF